MTKKMYSDYEYERVECAESGYGLDVLIKLKDGQATVILQKIICTLEKEGYKWREGPNDTTEFAKD